MIRYKILRMDEGTQGVLGQAKSYARRLISLGHRSARKIYNIGAVTVMFRCVDVGHTDSVVTITLTKKRAGQEPLRMFTATGSVTVLDNHLDKIFVSEVTYSDDLDPNVVGVNDSPVFKRCSVKIGRGVSKGRGWDVVKQFYKDKHIHALRDSVSFQSIAVRPPPALRYLLNEVVIVSANGDSYFFTDADGDMAVMMRLQANPLTYRVLDSGTDFWDEPAGDRYLTVLDRDGNDIRLEMHGYVEWIFYVAKLPFKVPVDAELQVNYTAKKSDPFWKFTAWGVEYAISIPALYIADPVVGDTVTLEGSNATVYWNATLDIIGKTDTDVTYLVTAVVYAMIPEAWVGGELDAVYTTNYQTDAAPCDQGYFIDLRPYVNADKPDYVNGNFPAYAVLYTRVQGDPFVYASHALSRGQADVNPWLGLFGNYVLVSWTSTAPFGLFTANPNYEIDLLFKMSAVNGVLTFEVLPRATYGAYTYTDDGTNVRTLYERSTKSVWECRGSLYTLATERFVHDYRTIGSGATRLIDVTSSLIPSDDSIAAGFPTFVEQSVGWDVDLGGTPATIDQSWPLCSGTVFASSKMGMFREASDAVDPYLRYSLDYKGTSIVPKRDFTKACLYPPSQISFHFVRFVLPGIGSDFPLGPGSATVIPATNTEFLTGDPDLHVPSIADLLTHKQVYSDISPQFIPIVPHGFITATVDGEPRGAILTSQYPVEGVCVANQEYSAHYASIYQPNLKPGVDGIAVVECYAYPTLDVSATILISLENGTVAYHETAMDAMRMLVYFSFKPWRYVMIANGLKTHVEAPSALPFKASFITALSAFWNSTRPYIARAATAEEQADSVAKAQALLAASYTVLINNFASKALLDWIEPSETRIIVPYKSTT